ncbi:hypothetical protein DZC30_00460 [Comamonas testosteroni]|uniref:Uncharacterized protein n=1 Tax=Comamonas testosteroni TaxID=285 RepID=A0A373FRY6_COMTE|nr:DUF6493 family protein [Comamonas testosteroni]RGE46924.1 hypothetical protein DZC30_00460 [Comamonas testosteroni]
MNAASNPDLNQRKTLLREALAASNVHDFAPLAAALQTASEEERAALAKTLPPSRLFTAEGGTARAFYALVALGKPKLAAETLVKDKNKTNYLPAALAAGRDRSEEWILAFCDELAEVSGWQQGQPLELALQLQAARGLFASSARYVGRIPYFLTADLDRKTDLKKSGQHIVEGLQSHGGLPMHAFWRFFEIEGLGSDYTLTDYQSPAWNAAIEQLGQSQSGFRERAIDASLDALLRDFSARNILWYLQVQRVLQPTAQEVAARQSRYLAVLGTQPSTAVGLAQELLASALKARALDTNALIEASSAVLLRTEKKLIKAQLKLLGEIPATTEQRQRISQVVEDALPSMPADLAEQARKLVQAGDSSPATQPATKPTELSNSEAIVIAPPRSTPLPGARPELPAIESHEALMALLAELLEGNDRGADLPRIFDYLARHTDAALPHALEQRAAQVIGELWDENHAAPQRLLLAALAGKQQPGFKGYRRYVVARQGAPDLPDVEYRTNTGTTSSYDPASGEMKLTETWTSRSGYQYVPTNSATALLADMCKALQQARQAGQAFVAPTPVPAKARQWQRQLASPGQGCFTRDLEVLGKGPKPFWIAANAIPQPASLHERALDVSQIAPEFTFRAQEAREQAGYDAIVHWAAWLLRDNLDTLAAQMHPVLCAAVQVINVRGLGPLLAALGASRQPPAQPVYSALALAASAKMAEHRAQTAEALAQLAAANLLDPEAFATQIAAHLADEFALAGRLAQTLGDASSISAATGLRVLQTLGALLPHLLDADGKPLTQASKLIELAARLSVDYGWPLPIPEALAARRKGSSALAVALRTLDAVTPQTTPLAREAASALS